MNEENMRNVVIYGENGFNALDALKNLPNWSFHKNQSEGHPSYLQNGETKIYLNPVASNVVRTSNVLPQDHMEQHPSFKDDALQRLVADLEDKHINHTLCISENDEKSL